MPNPFVNAPITSFVAIFNSQGFSFQGFSCQGFSCQGFSSQGLSSGVLMKVSRKVFTRICVVFTILYCVFLSACTSNNGALDQASGVDKKKGNGSHPSAFFLDKNYLTKHYYDGATDDLATAGLGLQGLRGFEPKLHDANQPSREELRRLAIYHNYKGLIALDSQSGYSRLFAKHWNSDSATDGKVAGYEIIAPLLFQDKSVAATLMLHIPDAFNYEQPCLLVTASSGSRGIYGALGVAGAWGLHHGCAVVYTDKGTGTGFHWLDTHEATGIYGELITTREVVEESEGNATAEVASATAPLATPLVTPLALFKHPAEVYSEEGVSVVNVGVVNIGAHRIATKHAHSQKNIDQYWDDFVFAAVDFAFAQINSHAKELAKKTTVSNARHYSPDNTLVIGAGISNGGASILRAAERDAQKVFDGVVVSEPAINLPKSFSYQFSENEKTTTWNTQSLIDVGVVNSLYMPCAALMHDNSGLAPFIMPAWRKPLENRCKALQAEGLLTGETLQAQSAEAHAILRKNGFTQGADALLLGYTTTFVWDAILVNYVNGFGQYSAEDNLCNLSYAYTGIDGKPVPTPAHVKHRLFGSGSGIVPTGSIHIINDDSYGGPHNLKTSLSPDGELDLGFSNLLCLKRALQEERVRTGLDKTRVSGNLNGVPAIIVHGQDDNLIQVNDSSRAYVALNANQEPDSQLHYYEVENAQHFDNLTAVPVFKTRFIPLHRYFDLALDHMLDKLQGGKALPPSQLVRTTLPEHGGVKLGLQHLPEFFETDEKDFSPITLDEQGTLLLP